MFQVFQKHPWKLITKIFLYLKTFVIETSFIAKHLSVYKLLHRQTHQTFVLLRLFLVARCELDTGDPQFYLRT